VEASQKIHKVLSILQTDTSVDILVCHGNVIRYCLCRALQLDPAAWLRYAKLLFFSHHYHLLLVLIGKYTPCPPPLPPRGGREYRPMLFWGKKNEPGEAKTAISIITEKVRKLV
jgi:hypothetical protein